MKEQEKSIVIRFEEKGIGIECNCGSTDLIKVGLLLLTQANPEAAEAFVRTFEFGKKALFLMKDKEEKQENNEKDK